MGNGEDFLFMHKHHMTQQTPHIFKVVTINNLEKLTPLSCWIQSGLHLKHQLDLEYLESSKAIKYMQKSIMI